MEFLLGIGIFLTVVLLIEGTYFLIRTIRNPERAEVKSRLQKISSLSFEEKAITIEREKKVSEIPWLNRLLLSFRWTDRLNLLLHQAGIQKPLGVFILLSLLLAFVGLLVGLRFTSSYLFSLIPMVILGILPFLYIFYKKKKRMDKFQSQFPEALDLMARALKAGHAFTSGLKMVSDEMGDPIGTEFGITVNEINFGADFVDALKNLTYRVDCPDLKFFTISVILQRETGGNLVEILENIAYLIRERFKFQGRVRVLAAQGKLSAIILVILPFLVATAFYFINPKYLSVLATDPIGKTIVLVALLLMILGIIVMKRMIDIRV